MLNRYCFFVIALVLSGCGGGTQVPNTPPPPPPAGVSISVSPASVQPGQSATLTWSASNATSCSASGNWTGSQQMSGSQNVLLSGPDALTFSLACVGPGGSTSQTAKLTAAGGPGGCTVHPAVRFKMDRRSSRHRASSQRTSGK